VANKRINAGKGDKRKLVRTVSALIAMADVLFIAMLAISSGDPLLRIIAGIVVLAISGEAIRNANRLEGGYGLYLLGGKYGIGTINALAKGREKIWNAFADFGLSVGFGILSYKFLKNKRIWATGIFSIILIMIFVMGNLSVILDFMPSISEKVAAQEITQKSTQSILPLLSYISLFVVSLVGGLSLLTIYLILLSGIEVLSSVFTAVSTSAYAPLKQQVPGVYPVIPGLTIPLAAGIMALALLLVVHEFSHGVLARTAKVKIKSVGLVLFGIIPFGAFVQPDENSVKRLPKDKQNRIYIAGISANIIASVIFLVLMFLVVDFWLTNINTQGVRITAVINGTPASKALSPGTAIFKWNNYIITNEYALERIESNYSHGSVKLYTSKGIVNITPMSNGMLGIELVPNVENAAYKIAYFLFTFFGLSFALNFFVGIFNLLPIPGFDGWRIYANEIKNTKLLNGILALIIVSILLNAIPWIWYF